MKNKVTSTKLVKYLAILIWANTLFHWRGSGKLTLKQSFETAYLEKFVWIHNYLNIHDISMHTWALSVDHILFFIIHVQMKKSWTLMYQLYVMNVNGVFLSKHYATSTLSYIREENNVIHSNSNFYFTTWYYDENIHTSSSYCYCSSSFHHINFHNPYIRICEGLASATVSFMKNVLFLKDILLLVLLPSRQDIVLTQVGTQMKPSG